MTEEIPHLGGQGADANGDEDEAQAVEDLVHEPLKGHPCILEPKGHAQELKEAKGWDESGLGDC